MNKPYMSAEEGLAIALRRGQAQRAEGAKATVSASRNRATASRTLPTLSQMSGATIAASLTEKQRAEIRAQLGIDKPKPQPPVMSAAEARAEVRQAIAESQGKKVQPAKPAVAAATSGQPKQAAAAGWAKVWAAENARRGLTTDNSGAAARGDHHAQSPAATGWAKAAAAVNARLGL